MIDWTVCLLVAVTLAAVAASAFAMGSLHERQRQAERERVAYGRGIVRGMELRDNIEVEIVERLTAEDDDDQPETH